MKRSRRELDPRWLTRLGMIAMLLYFGIYWLLPRFAGAAWGERLEGASGVALGLAIGFVFLAVWVRRRRPHSSEPGTCERG